MFTDSRRKRRQRHRMTVVGILFIVLGMAMYGYNTSREQFRLQAESEITPTPISTFATPNVPVIETKDPVIEEHAEVVLITRYLGCGHEKEQTLALDNLVGLTEKQLAALYPLYAIVSFSPTRVEMRKDVEGVCPLHYLVKLEDNVLVIYQRDTDDSWRRVQVIEDFYMPYQDERLIEGVVFDDMHQIESFLENFDN